MDISEKIALSALATSSVFTLAMIIINVINVHKNKHRKTEISSLEKLITSSNKEIAEVIAKQRLIEQKNSELSSNYLELMKNQEETKMEIFNFVKAYLDSLDSMKETQNRLDIAIFNLKGVGVINKKSVNRNLIAELNMLELENKRMKKK